MTTKKFRCISCLYSILISIYLRRVNIAQQSATKSFTATNSVFTKAQTWEIIFDTLLPGAGVKVLEISPQNHMRIDCSTKTLVQLEALLHDRREMKAKIKHALNKTTYDTEAAAEHVYLQLLDNFVPKTGREVMDKLVSQEFQETIGIAKISFTENPDHTSTFKVTGKHPLDLKRKMVNLEFLLSAFSDAKHLCKIMLDQAHKISGEATNGEISPESTNILKSEDDTTTLFTKTVLFNHGFLAQMIQTEFKIGVGQSPALARETNSPNTKPVYTLDTDALLHYLGEVFDTRMILHPEAENTARPIALGIPGDRNTGKTASAESMPLSSARFKFIIDLSGSITDYPTLFQQYKEKITSLIEEIIKNVDSWSIDIITFGDKVSPTITFTNSTKGDLLEHIKKMESLGMTALYDAIITGLSLVDTEDHLIVITDGSNNVNNNRAEEIAPGISDLLSKNEKSTFTTIGFGTADKKFFDTVAQNEATTHIQLDDLNALEQFMNHFGILGRDKVIHKFLDALGKIQGQLQAVAREAVVSTFTVNDDNLTVESKTGGSLKFGVEEYELVVGKDGNTETVALPVGEALDGEGEGIQYADPALLAESMKDHSLSDLPA